MALDEALMESVRGGGPPVLRFYRWEPACLSFGRNQPAAGLYDREEIARRGIDVVRRPTGGRAVLHARELTYSVTFPERLLGSLRQSYATINRALLAGLHRLGVPATLQPRSSGHAALPSISPCFAEPAEGEVVVAGRKLVGSAQYRQRGVVLQHGSLLLANDQELLRGLVTAPGQRFEAPPAALEEYCSPLPTWPDLTAALAEGWRRTLGASLVPDEPQSRELELAKELEDSHADLEWIWRR